MVLALVIIVIVLAAGAAAWFFGPPKWRETAVGHTKGLPGRFRDFIERGRAPEISSASYGSASRAPRFTDADRAYLAEVWRHAQSTFVSNPKVAVNLAHHTTEGFFHAHGIDVSSLPPGAANGYDEADTEQLRLRLLAIKEWADREAAV